MIEIFDYIGEDDKARRLLSGLRTVPVPFDSARYDLAKFGREFRDTIAGRLCVMRYVEERQENLVEGNVPSGDSIEGLLS
jgi:hypothetical protein